MVCVVPGTILGLKIRRSTNWAQLKYVDRYVDYKAIKLRNVRSGIDFFLFPNFNWAAKIHSSRLLPIDIKSQLLLEKPDISILSEKFVKIESSCLGSNTFKKWVCWCWFQTHSSSQNRRKLQIWRTQRSREYLSGELLTSSCFLWMTRFSTENRPLTAKIKRKGKKTNKILGNFQAHKKCTFHREKTFIIIYA